MKILALEFSSPQRSVALVESPGIVPVGATPPQDLTLAVLNQAAVLGFASARQAEPAMHLVESVLKEAGLEREAVECIVVGLGPGSYTGIRGAISMAQGWQLGRDIRLLGIGSMECLAFQAAASAWTGRLLVTVDAQRGELYLAEYDVDESSCRLVSPLRITNPNQLPDIAQARVIGPEADRWTPAGQVVFPDARMLGKLAATRDDYIAGEKLEPIYLRETNFAKAPPPRILPPLPPVQ